MKNEFERGVVVVVVLWFFFSCVCCFGLGFFLGFLWAGWCFIFFFPSGWCVLFLGFVSSLNLISSLGVGGGGVSRFGCRFFFFFFVGGVVFLLVF